MMSKNLQLFASYAATAAMLIVNGVLGLSATPAAAQGIVITGSCVGFDLTPHVRSEQNPLGEGIAAIALYDGVPTFSDATASQTNGELALGEVVTIIEDGELVGVRAIGGSQDSTRFVSRNDLRCENKPLYSETTGLERKAVIRVGTVRSDATEGRTVAAYRTPSLDDCDETCRKLSRFDLYFVSAETDRALLLSREVRIATTSNSPMVGWISKDDVYEWPYSVGLRVREDYTFDDGYGVACGYLTLEEAREGSEEKCQPMLGGPSWFETSTRLLVMQQYPVDPNGGTDDPEAVIFETVAPITSRASESVRIEDGKIVDLSSVAINPDDLRGASTDVLLRNNRIDLFFLIDGTKSMLPHIDAIRGANGQDGIIQTMLNGFQREISDGIRFRAGFRMFRDTNGPDKNSIGEGFPLPEQDCGKMTVEDSVANLSAFNEAIATVDVTTDDKDDYPEDLYGGIEQALRDIRGCSDNRKLVFVITDAGYDAEMQASRGVEIPDLDRFAERFNSEFAGGAIFFIRPPLDSTNTNEKYISAWEKVSTDAVEVIRRLDLVKELVEQGDDIDYFFSQLDGSLGAGASIVGEINENIIKKNLNPEAIDNLIIDIRGGASLQQAIERLKTENKDIPGYFWRLVEQGACEDLGDACTEATYQSVTKVFVRNEPEKIALDVWMDDQQLRDWDDLLNRVTAGDQSFAEMRKSAVNAIDDAIRTVIREPPYDDENEKFGEYLSRAGKLPIGFRTPLLGYSLSDLIRADTVSICEIQSLIAWLDASRQMMKIASQADTLPDAVISQEAPPCPNMTVSGQGIRLPTGNIGERRLASGSLRTNSAENQLSKPIYWIPQKYLP